ncbi:MAG: glycoside hydrolase family 5 protein, partial [Acidobacteriota bacterium]|nr:glycoside hydrolase family 5 protein [Acidobacteriota bacterium]
DFWDLVNEGTNSDEFLNDIAAFIKANDPYRHPITTSFADYIAPIVVHDLPATDFTSPHIYDYSYVETEFLADTKILSVTDKFRSYNKPIIVGEWGNEDGNYAPKSALRMRLRNWAAFFGEVSLIYWNTSWDKVSPRNIYLGVEERGYVKVLQGFTKAIDANARMVNIEVNKPASVRGYALSSPTGFFAYLHAFTNHQSQTSDTTVNVNLQKPGTATWIEPASGRILATKRVPAGRQTLTVPPFLIDIALKVTDSRSAEK